MKALPLALLIAMIALMACQALTYSECEELVGDARSQCVVEARAASRPEPGFWRR